MQVEVYFGEDACTSAGIYSVRNEISALSWILSLIPVSCEMQTQVDTFEALRAAVKSRISEVVGAETEKARVVDSYRCEKESRLVEWGQDNGVKTKLQIARKLSGFSVMKFEISTMMNRDLFITMWFVWTEIDGYGRGAIASEDLKFGDVALEIPISSIISEEYVYNSDMVNHFFHSDLKIASVSSYQCYKMSVLLSSVPNIGED